MRGGFGASCEERRRGREGGGGGEGHGELQATLVGRGARVERLRPSLEATPTQLAADLVQTRTEREQLSQSQFQKHC